MRIHIRIHPFCQGPWDSRAPTYFRVFVHMWWAYFLVLASLLVRNQFKPYKGKSWNIFEFWLRTRYPYGMHNNPIPACATQSDIGQPAILISDKPLSTGRDPESWRKTNVVPICRKDKRADLCNYSPVGLTLIWVEIMGCLLRDLFNKELKGIT